MNGRTTSLYWAELDGIRALAFVLVLLSHIGTIPLANVISLSRFSVLAYNTLIEWGWVGVDLFFVLSGFLITSILLKEREKYADISLRFFLTRRALRIWPLYYLALLLGFLIFPVVGVFGSKFGSDIYWEMVDNYLLYFAFFFGNFSFTNHVTATSAIVAPLWSVCIEEQFYLFWGTCFRFIRSQNVHATLLILMLLASILTRSFLQINFSDYQIYYYCTFARLDPIVMGCLLGLFYKNRFKNNFWNRMGKISFFLSLALLFYIIFFSDPIFANHPSIIWSMTLVAIAWALFLFAVLSVDSLRSFFGGKRLAAFGRLTYGMYIFHGLSIQLVAKCLNIYPSLQSYPLFFPTKVGIILVLNWFLAKISWKLIEYPCYMLKKKFTRVSSGYQCCLDSNVVPSLAKSLD